MTESPERLGHPSSKTACVPAIRLEFDANAIEFLERVSQQEQFRLRVDGRALLCGKSAERKVLKVARDPYSLHTAV